MTLTAFSITRTGEFDVDQILEKLSAETGHAYMSVERIPDEWRAHLRADLKCPDCSVTGAEVVRSVVAGKSGKPKRQSFFRFTTPGHHPFCDYANPDATNAVPETLVAFSESRSNLTRAVRDLVCTGIEVGSFSQGSIRSMRDWFFNKKVESMFVVSLDPRTYPWIDALRENAFHARGALPTDVEITPEIAELPNFNWRAQAARLVQARYPQHQANMRALIDQHIGLFGASGKRSESLARRYAGRPVFNPTVLASEYRKTLALSEFIAHTPPPLNAVKDTSSSTGSVLALSALLLFGRDWDISKAIADFAKISPAVGTADQQLGNVMGLNPFHDYEAWAALKKLQDLNIQVPKDIDIKAERVVVEAALRAKFGVSPPGD
ncbi:hypothetical protein [Delftia lacustris]|uniref:hypothetical protein n=1 Tax=Delftia lacustris TaxID=558537 RepID=UPI0006405384|nr:hypothetical protein [Delftia lacustris]